MYEEEVDMVLRGGRVFMDQLSWTPTERLHEGEGRLTVPAAPFSLSAMIAVYMCVLYVSTSRSESRSSRRMI